MKTKGTICLLVILIAVILTVLIFRPGRLVVGTFNETELPPEANRGDCFFYFDSNDMAQNTYLLTQDFEGFGYIKINGKLEKLNEDTTLQNRETFLHYYDDTNDVTIEIINAISVDEYSSKINGKFYISHHRKDFTTDFVGYCGP